MALFGTEEAADIAEGPDEGVVGSGSDAAEVGFQLGEGHLDGGEGRLGNDPMGSFQP